MSSRARRESRGSVVVPFQWGEGKPPGAPAEPSPQAVHDLEQMRASLEREAFTKGYAQGERAGAEAAATRAEGMLRRLKDTLEELTTLRADMLHRTERQIVQ